MRKLIFQVEFKSDIVLPASSNTEGNISQLDFIPGSNFLGMVAKNYGKFSNSFDIFHSGKVRFGDATLLVDAQVLYKMPFSFFHPKLEENRVFQHHFLDDIKRKDLGQLKQMRSGYIFVDINSGLKVEHINYNYAQKSAYESKNRRSKTSSMYGYKAIEAGTKWQFALKHDASVEDIDLIKSTLEKSKRLGKSKSSQYGQIEITYIKEQSSTTNKSISDEELIIYANSRIALVDSAGNATYDLKYLVDKLKDENIVYDKCQIRTSTFTPYNGAMQTKTYERLVIEKGSVIVLKDLKQEQIEALQKGVGLYLAEGFGELLINPSFLMNSGEMALIKKDKESKKDEREKITTSSKKDTVKFLINRHNRELEKLALADEVAIFIKENKSLYEKIKNSQWGTIRSICTAGTENFKDDIRAYTSSGKVEWSSKQIEKLLDDEHDLKFIKLVSIQMPKEENKNDK